MSKTHVRKRREKRLQQTEVTDEAAAVEEGQSWDARHYDETFLAQWATRQDEVAEMYRRQQLEGDVWVCVLTGRTREQWRGRNSDLGSIL